MLGLEEGVTEDGGGGCHGYVFVGGEGVPYLVEEGAVVYAEGRGDAFAEAGPVLGGNFQQRWMAMGREEANFGVIAFCPFEECGVQAKVVCPWTLATRMRDQWVQSKPARKRDFFRNETHDCK